MAEDFMANRLLSASKKGIFFPWSQFVRNFMMRYLDVHDNQESKPRSVISDRVHSH